MAQVIVDPSEMRKFETALRELQSEIDARRNQLAAQIGDARSFWDDDKYTEFQRKSEELMLEVQYFSKLCDQYCSYLRNKAAAADTYLFGR